MSIRANIAQLALLNLHHCMLTEGMYSSVTFSLVESCMPCLLSQQQCLHFMFSYAAGQYILQPFRC